MAWKNNLREIRIILYRLKRNFGLQGTLKKPLTNVNDVTTGQVTRTFQEHTIKRIIMLPSRSLRDFKYDLSYIAASKNFTYGGFFDTRTRYIIIDVNDLPSNFELTTNCFIVFENRRYDIKEFELAEHNQGWLITGIELDSSDAET